MPHVVLGFDRQVEHGALANGGVTFLAGRLGVEGADNGGIALTLNVPDFCTIILAKQSEWTPRLQRTLEKLMRTGDS